MSAYLYDEQLLNKLKRWYEGTDLHIYGESDMRKVMQVIADESGDKPIQLPILVLSRPGGYTINNLNKQPMTYEGLRTSGNITDKNAVLYGIPVTLNYQLDIYTRYYQEADLFSRDLIFNIINHPTIDILLEYNGVKYNHNATIRISNANVADNSNVSERFISGMFTRLTLNLSIDDAYIWNIKQKSSAILADVLIDQQ